LTDVKTRAAFTTLALTYCRKGGSGIALAGIDSRAVLRESHMVRSVDLAVEGPDAPTG
jgi:hypothetical protein